MRVNTDTQYLFLVANPMAELTLKELKDLEFVTIINKSKLPHFFHFEFLAYFLLQNKLNKYAYIPFRRLVYKFLLQKFFKIDKKAQKLCVILSSPWYNRELVNYLKKGFPTCSINIQFIDTVDKNIENNRLLTIDSLRTEFDNVLVYSPDDAANYEFTFCPAGYSAVDCSLLRQYNHVNLCFIGAAKNRLGDIRAIYKKMTSAGVSCFFYVTGVPASERREDGIIYADKNMPFIEYLSRENSADCLLEILQDNSTGRTYRLMEAIIYNKKLITNCPEILTTKFYNQESILYFKDINTIDPHFVKNKVSVNYNYNGEFSPVRIIDVLNRKENETY